MKYVDQAVELTKDRPDSAVGKAARAETGSADETEQWERAGTKKLTIGSE